MTMEALGQIRKSVIIISQICGLILYSYFIYNVQNYNLSWRWLWLLPVSWATQINSYLSSIGTLVLVIPLLIIVVGLLHPTSIGLRVASSFLSIGGIFTIMKSGFLTAKGVETFNMKLFTLSKILSLEEKRTIFKEEFINLVELTHKQTKGLYDHLIAHIPKIDLGIYDAKFNILENSSLIKVYAKEIIDQLQVAFTQTTLVQTTTEYSYWIKVGIGTLVGIFLLATGIRYLLASDLLAQGAKLQKDGAELAAQTTGSVENLQLLLQQVLKQIAELTQFVQGAITKLTGAIMHVDENTAKAVATLQEHQSRYNKTLETLANVLRYLYNKSKDDSSLL